MDYHVDGFKKMSARTAAMRKRCERKIEEFRREERGSMIIFGLFIFILMLMISGMAVDLMRAETQRARLQSTLDRAVLAGASLDQALDSEAVVRDYFAKAGLSAFLTDVQVIPGDNSNTVTASAFMQVNSYFMHMMGIDSLDAPASGTAQESLSNIEISLVVDVSGSMREYSDSGQRKIHDLIDAAQDFVYLMQCNPDETEVDGSGNPVCNVEADTVSISLIPYSEQVVVGEALLQKFNNTNEHTRSSCADFEVDSTASINDFASTAIPLTSSNPIIRKVKRSADLDPWQNFSGYRRYTQAYDSKRTCRKQAWREIMPLSNDYEDLQDAIGDLDYGGNTSIDIGMKWGVGLLDPAFRPAVATMTTGANPVIDPAFANRPYDYNQRSMQKVVVLMTDGVNTTQHVVKDAYRSGPSNIWFHHGPSVHPTDPFSENTTYCRDDKVSLFNPTRSVPSGQWCILDGEDWSDSNKHCKYQGAPYAGSFELDYSEVWTLLREDIWDDYNWLENPIDRIPGSDTDAIDGNDKNTRLYAICDAAKDQKIEVFTIGFETSSTSAGVMKNCASSESHHFDATGLDLDEAFTTIAREIHELRLTN